MQDYPHHYIVNATAAEAGDVSLEASRLPALVSAPPAEFGGPGDRWSPETLLVAAIADCFVLTFRAIARASKLEWRDLSCSVVGKLERVDRAAKFTEFTVSATLKAPPQTDRERARRLLEKAEEACLVTNSLSGTVHLEARVEST
jgi:peroxiredoxin-like protein